MKAIWKFTLGLVDIQTIEIPRWRGGIMSVAERDGRLCLWAAVDTSQKDMACTIRIYGTGHAMDYDPGHFLGTVVMSNGLVWHVFIE